MQEQTEIPGTRPTICAVPHKRAHKLLIDSGGCHALDEARKELEALQKQHPMTAGLTLAIAVVSRRAAEKQMESSREVLIRAAQAGMQIEGCALALVFSDDGLRIESIAGEKES